MAFPPFWTRRWSCYLPCLLAWWVGGREIGLGGCRVRGRGSVLWVGAVMLWFESCEDIDGGDRDESEWCIVDVEPQGTKKCECVCAFCLFDALLFHMLQRQTRRLLGLKGVTTSLPTPHIIKCW